jgi:DNA-binding NarL/FixJ family response regulator
LQASHRLLLETAALHTEATIVRIFTACAGIALLADMDRMEDLPALRDPNLLEDAFATGEGQHFGPLAAAHAHAALLSNEPEIAAALGNRAIAGMTSTAYASAAVVTFARCVTDDNLEQVDALIRVLPSAGVPRLHHLLAQAIVASRRGETEHARRLAAVLIDTAHRAASPLVEAQALELAGRRSDALAIYERIGAAAHIRRMAPRKSRELTAREREIANLIASGMSNRDIATRLIVSERTVEHHAAALYGKLGVKRRAEFIASRTRPVNHSG